MHCMCHMECIYVKTAEVRCTLTPSKSYCDPFTKEYSICLVSVCVSQCGKYQLKGHSQILLKLSLYEIFRLYFSIFTILNNVEH